jgi:TatD DNase family protein
VKAIISNGTSQASNEAVRELCQAHPLIRPAYGLFPTEPGTQSTDAAALAWIHEQAVVGAYPPVAIGEVGLDGVEPVTAEQRERFRACCVLATQLRLPIIVHSRKAEQLVFDELAALQHTGPVILHCFGGSKKLVREAVERKYYFSIPALLPRSSQFQMLVELTPLSQLLTETDSPYLGLDKAVFPNEPSSVVQTVAAIAAQKRITPEECRQVLFLNCQRLFFMKR